LDRWPKDIEQLGFGCFANFGRSIIAQIIAETEMQKGNIPEFRVFSGALSPNYEGTIDGLHPLTHKELEKRGYEGWYLRQKRFYSKTLGNTHIISDRTDLVFFVPGYQIDHRLVHNLPRYDTIPKSIVCIPLEDPSEPRKGISPEEAIHETYDRIHHIVTVELGPIMLKVRSGDYTYPRYKNKGVIYPYGLKPEPVKGHLFGEAE
jgi:protein-tyrosine-phosphatase